MSSVRRPRMPKPRIPKLKKPVISKAKRLRKKLPTLSLKQTSGSTKMKKSSGSAYKSANKKKTTRKHLGTCYLQAGCKSILAKDVSKAQCKKMGGKSWKISGGTCERLAE